MKTMLKTKAIVSFTVDVTQHDIDEGRCGLVSLCMHKVAIERALRKKDPRGGDHKVRIDGGHFRFNYRGHRYRGSTPSRVKATLVQFDSERKARDRAEKNGEKFVSKVKPHRWKAEAERGGAIQPFTRERQEQINEARRRRVAAGKPDKMKYDLRHRVEGLGQV